MVGIGKNIFPVLFPCQNRAAVGSLDILQGFLASNGLQWKRLLKGTQEEETRTNAFLFCLCPLGIWKLLKFWCAVQGIYVKLIINEIGQIFFLAKFFVLEQQRAIYWHQDKVDISCRTSKLNRPDVFVICVHEWIKVQWTNKMQEIRSTLGHAAIMCAYPQMQGSLKWHFN